MSPHATGMEENLYTQLTHGITHCHGENMPCLLRTWGTWQNYDHGHLQGSKLCLWTMKIHIDGLVQDCSNPSVLSMELLQSWTKPLILLVVWTDKSSMRWMINQKLHYVYFHMTKWMNVWKYINTRKTTTKLCWSYRPSTISNFVTKINQEMEAS